MHRHCADVTDLYRVSALWGGLTRKGLPDATKRRCPLHPPSYPVRACESLFLSTSGPSGKFRNIQSHCASANQGAFRRQWPLPWQETQHRVALAQRLPKGRATSIVGGVAVLGKGLPFPADCALPTLLVAWLSVTELSAWPTSALSRK